MAHRAQAVLIADGELVFAGLVGEIGDGFAVGRPCRIAVGNGRTARDIANVTLVGGHGENLSPGFENGPRAGRGNAEVLNALGFDFGEVRAHRFDVSGNVNGDVPAPDACSGRRV